MSRHGHRHSRPSRPVEHHEVAEDNQDTEDNNPNILRDTETKQKPMQVVDPLLTEICDPIHNATCLHDVPIADEAQLLRREEADSTQVVAAASVQTVVQVVETTSQTLSVSVSADFSMTASVSISDVDAPITSAFNTTSLETSTTPPTYFPATSPATQTTSLTKKGTASSPPKASSHTFLPITSTPLGTTVAPTSASTSTNGTSLDVLTGTSSNITSANTISTPYPSTSSSSSSSNSSGDYSSISSTYSFSSSSLQETSTVSGTVSAPTSSNTQVAPVANNINDSTTSTPQIVGGVVGGVAGLAVLFLFLLFLYRRRVRKGGADTLPSSDARSPRDMMEHSSSLDPIYRSSYFAPAFMKRWRQSTATTATDTTYDSNSSERGFQKISGRKIPPVLTHGGDGYGGGVSADDSSSVADLHGLSPSSPAGGPLSSLNGPPPTLPYGVPLDTTVTREADEPQIKITRPPLPHSNSVNTNFANTITPTNSYPQPQSAIPDGLGRSLVSHDGSRGSRFTESLDL